MIENDLKKAYIYHTRFSFTLYQSRTCYIKINTHSRFNMHTHFKKLGLAVSISAALCSASSLAIAQSNEEDNAEQAEIIEVKGIRSALSSALNVKRNADSIKEVIKADDIGKLPDQNLAEVLENLTGVQIDRTNGVGTGVQIRGTGDNRIEINGVATVGSGSGRTGISFDDLPAALIAAVEVTKAPTAKTVEGAIGGTINLQTLRGNSLNDTLAQFRIQSENSDLADSTTPRISGTFGDNWQLDAGKLGVVVTGSYAEQDVASANPRFDRDRVVLPDSGRGSAEEFPFLRTQFLDQPLNAANYETKNFTLSLEFDANNDVKYFFDATVNDQERVNANSRAFFSGTGGNPVIDNTTNTGFETIDLGSLDGQFGPIDLGSVTVVTSGILGVGSEIVNGRARIDPNLRTSNSNGARLTTSRVFATGAEWATDRMKFAFELNYSDSKTNGQSLNSSLDFINPNGIQPAADTFEDNGTPAEFNIANGTFEFGIAPGLAESPSSQDMLNPANYALRSLGQGTSFNDGSEKAAKFDFEYDLADDTPLFTTIHAGVRYNDSFNTTGSQGESNNFRNWNRPRADLFSDVVVPGAPNFNDADNRNLFIQDYLIISNQLSYNNPQQVIDIVNQAITQNNANFGEELNPLLNVTGIETSTAFEIEEQTFAAYVQGDYEFEVSNIFVRGNVGVRYVSTDLESRGSTVIDGVDTALVDKNDYSFALPRLNMAAELSDNMQLRLGIGKDIRRPDFNALSSSVNFGTSASATVTTGNPDLKPEQIWSYDLSLEYYLSSTSYVSVGLFHKERKDLIALIREEPEEPIGSTGQIERDVTAPCEGGGIFNPNVPPANYNVFSSREDTFGICVPRAFEVNAEGEESQTGIEIAAQYDLAGFEDDLGWASGFGIIANYTYQESGEALDDYRNGSAAINTILGRTDTDGNTPTTADDVVTSRIVLDKLSKNSYNFTLFYEKYGISARVRYTWRDKFTETLNRMRFNLPPVVAARGQLNANISYDINENYTIGIEGVNLTKEDRTRYCFNEGTLLCEQSLTDRRITIGITGRL